MTSTYDETATSKPLPSTDIARDRKRALAAYENGDIGWRRLRAWLGRLDEQEGIRSTIVESLEDSEQAISDTPIKRDRTHKRTKARRLVSKFARSL